MRIWQRIRAFGPWSRPRLERDLEREIQNHLSLEAAESGDRRRLGSVALVKEDVREAWGWTRLEQFARDAGYGLRQLHRNPAFSAIAVATLALGIGGITAMFSAFDAVLIRPLPYANAGRLVMIWDDLTEVRKIGGPSKSFPTPAEWLEWRHYNSVFTDIASSQPGTATLSGDSAPEQVQARKVTGNLWNVLAVKPLIGRVFTEDEDQNKVRVVVISYGLWQRRYGGSPDVLGRKISINDNPYDVIGVMPREFYFLPGRDIDIWMPASFAPWMLKSFGWHDEHVVARLKPGVTLERASESMAALSLHVTAAKDFRPHSVIVTPLREDLTGKTQTALVLLLCASAALLLIACVNLANLLLSRSAARGREVAVRVALGAGRARLVAQLLTESLVLAGLGAAAGLALAVPAMRFLETLVPETMGVVRLTVDWRVLVFSACAALAATLTFGLAPALRGSQLIPQDALREGGRGTAGARRQWFQHSLIVIETALAVVLLTSGGLLLQTIQHLRNTDLGLRSEKLLTFETPLFRYRDFNRRLAFVNAMLDRIRATPGVVHASATSQFPLTVNNTHATFYLFAGQPSERSHDQVALMRSVSRDYFGTIGAALREGRVFDSSDQRSESPVAIVNETFAKRHFPGLSAIGARFQLNGGGYWYTIVGLVKEIREVGMAEGSMPVVYRVLEQTDQVASEPSGIVVRTSVEPSFIVSAIRQAVWSVDKNQPIWHVKTFDAILDSELSTPAQSTTLMTAFALLALMLASLGLYGVLSYAITQRTKEIGVRMALGATSSEILLSFGKRGLALTVAGLVIGLVLASIAARSMTTLLYGFRPDYVPTATAVSLILLAVAALACFIPARRASRVDPVVALRNE